MAFFFASSEIGAPTPADKPSSSLPHGSSAATTERMNAMRMLGCDPGAQGLTGQLFRYLLQSNCRQALNNFLGYSARPIPV